MYPFENIFKMVNIYIYIVFISENSFAPEIRVVDQLLINGTEEFGYLHDIVEVLDADTPEKDLIIYLVKPPENGNIAKINHRKNVILSAKDAFSLREMQSYRVIYIPGEDKMTKGSCIKKCIGISF